MAGVCADSQYFVQHPGNRQMQGLLYVQEQRKRGNRLCGRGGVPKCHNLQSK